jgi:hypothetical protein
MINAATIAGNIARFESDLAAELGKSGKRREDIRVVAVSKTFPAPLVEVAATAGLTDFGENRVQEAKSKIPLVQGGSKLKWHLIGHLQSNKAKDAVALFDLIQSVDRIELAEALNHRAELEGMRQYVLLQVNTTRESQKSGCDPYALDDLLAAVLPLSNIGVQGLMTIGPFADDPAPISQAFGLLRREFDRLSKLDLASGSMRWCSMGMSGDWPIALAEGANMLRVGSAIFGGRG